MTHADCTMTGDKAEWSSKSSHDLHFPDPRSENGSTRLTQKGRSPHESRLEDALADDPKSARGSPVGNVRCGAEWKELHEGLSETFL
jgi:hypothetical protein